MHCHSSSSARPSGWLQVFAATLAAQDKPQPQVKLPESGVPQVITMEGKFVRAAYNNEGYVIIGYQPANRSIGEDWLLIDVGITVREGVKNYTMKREALSLETPDGKTHPLPSIEEHRKGNTQALQNRERVQRDSINYFPTSASRACAMTFFPDLTSRAMPQDDVELSRRARVSDGCSSMCPAESRTASTGST